MTKRYLFFLIAMLGMTLQSMGQPQFIKYVHVTTENVNMRKAPSTNSAKLMEVWNEGLHDFVWSGTSAARGAMPCHPQQDEVLGVVGSTGEWLKVLKNGAKCESGECTKEYAYILAKFCEEVHPMSTTPAMYSEYRRDHGSNSGVLCYRSTGKYKGYVIARFYRCNEGDSYGGLRLGKCEDGKIILGQSIVMDIIPDFTQTKIYINPRAKYDMYAKELNYGTNYKDGAYIEEFDMNKLTDADVNLIFGNVIIASIQWQSCKII